MENTKNLRMLYLARLLYERTDEEHMLTTRQIQDILREEHGISAHRVTIYEDMEQLRAFGMDIVTVRSSQNLYYLASRLFDLPELKLLIDAVSSSKFITRRKSQALVEKLVRCTSQAHAEDLHRDLYLEGRVKQDNEKIYYIVDAIFSAIRSGKKLAFRYYNYNARKEQQPQNDGAPYLFSPWVLVCSGERYYVLGWSDKHQTIACFRVDRILEQPDVLAEDGVPMPEDFDVAQHLNLRDRMYCGRIERVELLCRNELMGAIVDRFGEDVETRPVDEEHFSLETEMMVDHIFFGWVFGFSGKLRILGPEQVKQEYRDMLLQACEQRESEAD